MHTYARQHMLAHAIQQKHRQAATGQSSMPSLPVCTAIEAPRSSTHHGVLLVHVDAQHSRMMAHPVCKQDGILLHTSATEIKWGLMASDLAKTRPLSSSNSV